MWLNYILQEAIALVLDVSPSMDNAAPGISSPLEKSLTAINMIIQRKVNNNNNNNGNNNNQIIFTAHHHSFNVTFSPSRGLHGNMIVS